MLPPLKTLFDAKGLHREKLTAERAVAAKARPDAARHAARLFIANIPLLENAVVALYHPIRDELDTEPLLDGLIDNAAKITLPVTPKRKGPLSFRAFSPGDALEKGAYGVMTPLETAPTVYPDIVVAPMLGFTRGGVRLGYGGGYYDRTLAHFRDIGHTALAVGYAYGAQEVDALPSTPLDQPLDWIVTEREAIRIAR